jgi:hypothetical protein
MKLTPTILFLAASAAGFAFLGQYRSAQSVGPAAITVSKVHFRGVPRDWSHQHLLFSNPGTEAEATKAGTHDRWLKIVNDPRYVLQQLQRQQPGQGPAAAQVSSLLATPHIASASAPDKKKKHRDWSMNLGAGNLLPNTYPAKWSFDTTTANCATDFVIFATGASGSSSQATIVAYNNLYSGCGGTVPSVYWQYNTGTSAINSLSPVFSADGSQVAFVQSSGGVSSLVVLKWAANASLLSLSTTAAASYQNCTAPCMAVLPFASGSLDGYASPYYDYANDIAYVGDNDGALHQFTGVFNGTPAETTAAPWPVALAGTLSSPVLDSITGRIMVGSQNGQLYSVNSSNGAVVGTSSSLGGPNGVYDAPLVDSSAAMVYAFAGAVVQFPVTFTSGAGTAVSTAVGNLPMFSGAFDNIYYTSNSSDPTGNLYVCGQTTTTNIQTLDRIHITSNVMGSAIVTGGSDPNSFIVGYQAPCSPVTEFYNASSTPEDRVFLSSQVGLTCDGTSGCWYGFDVTSGSPADTDPADPTGSARSTYGVATLGTSGIIVDNMVGSGTLAGASQLYFTTFGNTGTCATSGGTGICGVQTSQLATSPTTCGGCDGGVHGNGPALACNCPVQEAAGCPQQTPPCSNYYTYEEVSVNSECFPTNPSDPSTYFGFQTLAGTYSSCYDNACVETGLCTSDCYPSGKAYVSATQNCPLGNFAVKLYNSLGDLVLPIYCSQIPASETAEFPGDLYHNCANSSYGGPFSLLPAPSDIVTAVRTSAQTSRPDTGPVYPGNQMPIANALAQYLLPRPDVILAASVVDPRAGTNHAQLFFGNQAVNTSATKTFTLNNRGATALSLTGMTVTGPNAAQFTLSPGSNCGSSLAALTKCTISVTFTPAAKVSYSAMLTVKGSGSLGTRTAALWGTGQ